MAKFLFGALWVAGRGRLGNEVASKNNSGTYLRQYVIPLDPNTTFQQDVRQLFSTITKVWSTLSNSERLTWAHAIDMWQYKNVFGERKKLTGQLLFNKLNLQAQSALFPSLIVAPNKMVMPRILLQSAIFTFPPRRIALNLNFSDPNVKVMIFATPALPQAAYSWKKTLRLIGVRVSNDLPSNTIHTLYRQKFANVTAGQNIFIGIKKVLSNGQASPLQILKLQT